MPMKFCGPCQAPHQCDEQGECLWPGFGHPECVTPQDTAPPELKAVLAEVLAKQTQ